MYFSGRGHDVACADATPQSWEPVRLVMANVAIDKTSGQVKAVAAASYMQVKHDICDQYMEQAQYMIDLECSIWVGG